MPVRVWIKWWLVRRSKRLVTHTTSMSFSGGGQTFLEVVGRLLLLLVPLERLMLWK
jgi:hypothetical protein